MHGAETAEQGSLICAMQEVDLDDHRISFRLQSIEVHYDKLNMYLQVSI